MDYKISCKTILTRVKPSSFWFYSDYNINLYRGCNHQCIYCDSLSLCYKNDDFNNVYYKEDAINILSKELSSKRKKGIISLGSMSDPYNALEEKMLLTQSYLKLTDYYGFGSVIITKSDLIVRDIPILKRISQHSPILVAITITTFDDQLAKIIEPNSPSPYQRFQALKKLRENGIFAGIIIMPILPFINDNVENIKNIIEKAHQVGAKFIHFGPLVTLRDRQRDYFYQKLDVHFPTLKTSYQNLFKNSYVCYSPNKNILTKVFRQECLKYNILTNMKEINEAFNKGYQVEQLAFFK